MERVAEQWRQKAVEVEREAQARQRQLWRESAPAVRAWYEIEQVKGCMSLNARQNVEKLIADLEAGGR